MNSANDIELKSGGPAQGSTSQTLTSQEQTLLDECEETIERGVATFLEVGQALLEVQTRQLYRTNYSSFPSYCRERWGFSRSRSYQMLDAGRVVAQLSTIVDSGQLPKNECQARALAHIKDPQLQAEVWLKAEQVACEEHIPVTASLIQEIYRNTVRPNSEIPIEKSSKSKSSNTKEPSLSSTGSSEVDRLLMLIENGLMERDLAKVQALLRKLRVALSL